MRILQITDFHLYSDPEKNYRGVLPTQTLDTVLSAITKRGEPIELILATGDLVADDWEAYGIIKERLLGLEIPVAILPGNHDNPKEMKKRVAGGPLHLSSSYSLDGWRIIQLNSALPGQVAGRLSQTELELLKEQLASHHDTHLLIALHHQPVPVGSAWMDAIGLENPEAFFALIDPHPQVRGIVFGHIHQAFDGWRGSIPLMGTPSTGLQFAANSQQMQTSAELPAYRILDLNPDGSIQSEVVRVTASNPKG
ncbi:MAG: phosphodiesterase [Magnetococcales bacterium]|nr:phosphodiesterase [Magnetococcales bacterium]